MTSKDNVPVAAFQCGGASNEISLKIFVCDVCNQSCWYCYNNMPRTRQMVNLEKVIEFASIVKDLAKNIAGKLPNVRIELIGGEPTIHPKFVETCKIARQNGFDVLVFSNLSQDREMYLDLASNYGVSFDFSWHSLENDKLNSKFLEKTRWLASKFDWNEKKKLLNFTVMLEPYNFQNSILAYRLIKTICQKYDSIGCEFLRVFDPKDASLHYSRSESKMISQMPDENYECSFKLVDGSTKEMTAKEIEDEYEGTFLDWICNASKQRYYVHCDNSVWPCMSWYQNAVFYKNLNLKPIANLLDSDLIDKLKDNYGPLVCKCPRCACESFVPKWREDSFKVDGAL